jgi:hypothetical protein
LQELAGLIMPGWVRAILNAQQTMIVAGAVTALTEFAALRIGLASQDGMDKLSSEG